MKKPTNISKLILPTDILFDSPEWRHEDKMAEAIEATLENNPVNFTELMNSLPENPNLENSFLGSVAGVLNKNDLAQKSLIKGARKVFKELPKNDDNSKTIPPNKQVFDMKQQQNISYKFNEQNIINELYEYINTTYSQHYAGTEGKNIQATEFIMDHCENFDFLKGNIIKYTARYGKKDGYNRKDLLKAMHYLIFALYYHDKRHEK